MIFSLQIYFHVVLSALPREIQGMRQVMELMPVHSRREIVMNWDYFLVKCLKMKFSVELFYFEIFTPKGR